MANIISSFNDPVTSTTPLNTNVQFQRLEFTMLTPIYRLIRDCLNKQVKFYTTRYLPKPDVTDTSEENNARYDAYVQRAVFYDVTSRTLNGLVGQIYTNEPEINLPTRIAKLEQNINGRGVGITQHSKEASELACSIGRLGLWTDFPQTNGKNPTLKQLQDGDISPTVMIYAGDAITNWQWKQRGSKQVLSLVVLYERYQHQIDEYQYDERIRYRVLKLVNDVYQMQVYEQWKSDDSSKFKENIELFAVPTDANNNTLNEIPFDFIGATNNDMEPDAPPLESMAELNVAHYRNSADYEESVFTVGQPTYVVTGLTNQWYKETLKSVIRVGSRNGIPLPVGADAKILQVLPNTMAKEAMDQKEAQMKAIGAKLIEVGQVPKTATEANITNSTEMSFLATIANNVTEAYQRALVRCCTFTGDTPNETMFELNTDFAINKMTAQERTELVAEWIKGAVTFSEMRRGLRDSGIATLDDTEAKAELQADQAAKDAQAIANATAMAAIAPPTAPNTVGKFGSSGA